MAAKENLLVKIAINSVVEAGKMMVTGLIAEIKANNNEEDYTELIKTMGNAFKLLEKAAAKTKTKTDDKVVDLFKEPIDQAAEADGIEI